MPIGWRPPYEVIELNLGDFVFSRISPKPLPPGTTAEIVWAVETEGEPLTWPAEVVGNTVSWRIAADLCTAAIVPHGTTYDMFIRYPTGSETVEKHHWKTGRADRVPADE